MNCDLSYVSYGLYSLQGRTVIYNALYFDQLVVVAGFSSQNARVHYVYQPAEW